jgi:hypothetical protein
MFNIYRISDSEKKVIAKANTEADAIQICETIGWNYSDAEGTCFWMDYEPDEDSKEIERLHRDMAEVYDALCSILTAYETEHKDPGTLYGDIVDLVNEMATKEREVI